MGATSHRNKKRRLEIIKAMAAEVRQDAHHNSASRSHSPPTVTRSKSSSPRKMNGAEYPRTFLSRCRETTGRIWNSLVKCLKLMNPWLSARTLAALEARIISLEKELEHSRKIPAIQNFTGIASVVPAPPMALMSSAPGAPAPLPPPPPPVFKPIQIKLALPKKKAGDGTGMQTRSASKAISLDEIRSVRLRSSVSRVTPAPTVAQDGRQPLVSLDALRTVSLRRTTDGSVTKVAPSRQNVATNGVCFEEMRRKSLRRVAMSRSPGGTPARENRSPGNENGPGQFMTRALMRKFKNPLSASW